MCLIIREALEKDTCEILALINNELGYPDVSLEELSSRIVKMKQQDTSFIFVADLDGSVIGFVTVVQGIALEMKSDYFRILEIAVAEIHQNKGIGKSLLEHIEALAVEKGVSYISLSCSLHRTDAHEFYKRGGYVKTSFTFAKGDKRI
jgi:ribosomal protein S18 acetylase RimI-like enzyme